RLGQPDRLAIGLDRPEALAVAIRRRHRHAFVVVPVGVGGSPVGRRGHGRRRGVRRGQNRARQGPAVRVTNMLKSAFIAFFRSFTRHPQYALLNLLGLSFGIAAFITLSLLYRFETSYESWSPERPHIYTIGTRFHFSGMSDDVRLGAMGGLLDELKSAWPQTDGTRDMSNGVIVHR